MGVQGVSPLALQTQTSQKKSHTDLQSKGKSEIKIRNIGFNVSFPFTADTTSAEDTNLPNERNE